MSLAILGLVILLVLMAFNWFAWMAISPILLGVVALVTAILFVLEGMSVVDYKVGR
jgi:hypothetical protein